MSRVGILLQRGRSTHAAEHEQEDAWPHISSPSEPGVAVQASRPGTHAAEHARGKIRPLVGLCPVALAGIREMNSKGFWKPPGYGKSREFRGKSHSREIGKFLGKIGEFLGFLGKIGKFLGFLGGK